MVKEEAIDRLDRSMTLVERHLCETHQWSTILSSCNHTWVILSFIAELTLFAHTVFGTTVVLLLVVERFNRRKSIDDIKRCDKFDWCSSASSQPIIQLSQRYAIDRNEWTDVRFNCDAHGERRRYARSEFKRPNVDRTGRKGGWTWVCLDLSVCSAFDAQWTKRCPQQSTRSK